MVCVPCIIIPVLLFIYHKFIQPFVLRFWNPWAKKDVTGDNNKTLSENPFDCADGVCKFSFHSKKGKIKDVYEKAN